MFGTKQDGPRVSQGSFSWCRRFGTRRATVALGLILTAAPWQAGCDSSGGLLEGLNTLFGGGAVVTSVSPLSGPTEGGTSVTIQGDGFSAGTAVLFGDTVAQNVIIANTGLITVQSPPRSAGAAPVILALPNGDKISTGYVFTYEAPDPEPKPLPPIGSVLPDRGPTAGGTLLTISGEGFENNMVVVIGAFLGTSVRVADSQTLTVLTPPQAPGTVDIVLRTQDGRSTLLAGGFTYRAPVVQTIAPPSGPTAGGTLITLTGQYFTPGTAVLFDSLTATDLVLINDTTLALRTPAHAAGFVTLAVVAPDGTTTTVSKAFEYIAPVPPPPPPPVDPVPGGPRLVSAISTGNTSVRVTFSEPVGDGADNAANYSIVQRNVNPEAGVLLVLEAVPGTDKTSVLLTTRSQNELVYELSVTNIKDLFGNPLAAPSVLVDPTRTTFAGTPAADNGQDTDTDGLSDAVEQSGRIITIKLANGQLVTRGVTSDPTLVDTDGDGLTDADEEAIGCDPRRQDTDGDMVTDYAEWNEWFSDPNAQDTDGDGLGDSLDLFFGTSPIIADTDGDQISDSDEIISRNRNPLLADLPLPQVTVDEVRLDLKVTSSYTDEQGTVRSITDSTSTTFTQSRSDTLGTSDTSSTESENEFSQKVGGEVSYSAKDGWGGKVTAEAGFGQKRTRGFSTTINRETARASQQEYQRSVQNALETSERRAVTRSIDEAIIQANVNIANQSDIAFTITNIEISVQQQDRRNGRRFRPIATLRPTGASDPLSQPSYNLGPFDPERGPIIFENVEVFPNLIDDLMREPTGLIFQVVNYDILDEFGRNFVFSSQEVNDRTVGITIDYGDGTVESFRVATNSKYDASGRPLGITMERALQIAGILRTNGDDTPFTPPADPFEPLPDTIRKTYGTTVNDNGFETLTRVRGVQNDLVAVPDAEKRFWAIITSNTDLPREVSFSSIQVHAGQDYLLLYTRDVDRDNLYEREEYLYGSSDRSTDTDGDGLTDFFEVRTGWTVRRAPGLPYKTFSDPSREDSDDDGIHDDVERNLGTDPNRSDTDEDGMFDAAEVLEEIDLKLFDGDADDTNDRYITLRPYSSWAIIDGGNGVANTTAAGDDEQIVAADGLVRAGDLVIGPGANGVLDTVPAGDDLASLAETIVNGPGSTCDTTASGDDIQVVSPNAAATEGQVLIRAGLNGRIDSAAAGDDYLRVVHLGRFSIDPLNRDTDFDGIPDGRELLIGTNPNRKDASSVTDSDGDGLYDSEEDAGWDVVVYATNGTSTTLHVTSNKNRVDTDQDGLPDVYEWAIRSNPRLSDTDGDSLLDIREFDPDNIDGYYLPSMILEAQRRCQSAPNCFDPTVPDPATRLRTHASKVDSDGDGRADNVELNTPWVVSVVGSNPYQAFSKPYSADADSDGLTDVEELSAGTDPNKADTDEDAVLGLDGTDSYEVGVGRNPLRKDQKVTFTYTHVVVVDNCEGTAGESGEFYGELYLTLPGSSTATTLYGCNNCCQVNTSGECGISTASSTFILSDGQSFTASSNQWYEDDSSSANDNVGSFTQSYTYPVSPTSDQYSLTGSNNCIAIKYTVTTQ